MSIGSFDLSSTERTRFDDGNYVYELHNQNGKLMIDIRSMRSMIRKAKPINITVPDTIDYYINLSRCFYKHKQLIDITVLESFNTDRVVNMTEMFRGCQRLTNLKPLSHWDVSNVKDMHGMFCDCNIYTDLSSLRGWLVSPQCILYRFYRDVHNDPNAIYSFADDIDEYDEFPRSMLYFIDCTKRLPLWLIDRHNKRIRL